MNNDQRFSWSLSVAGNVATNGRLFCLMLFAVCLTAFILGYGTWFARLAVFAALPVGLSCLVDQIGSIAVRSFAATLTYSLAAVVTVLFLASIG